jgi:hypothetical protein
MINVWERYHTQEGVFGDATIKPYDLNRAGELCDYLAKERCKDLDCVEGSGSVFEKFGFSRGVRKYVNAGVDILSVEDLKKLIAGEPKNGRSSDPVNILRG